MFPFSFEIKKYDPVISIHFVTFSSVQCCLLAYVELLPARTTMAFHLLLSHMQALISPASSPVSLMMVSTKLLMGRPLALLPLAVKRDNGYFNWLKCLRCRLSIRSIFTPSSDTKEAARSETDCCISHSQCRGMFLHIFVS